MKRPIITLVILAVAVILVLTGCVSSIAVKTLVPAKVDVSGYKTIAVRSTQDETRWVLPIFWNSTFPIRFEVNNRYKDDLVILSRLDFNVSGRITEAASSTICKAINTGFFTVLEPRLTDSIVTVGEYGGSVRQALIQNNVDALLTTKISDLYYDEYVTQESGHTQTDGITGQQFAPLNFYAVQKYAITIFYTLTDVENNKIIASGTFSSGMKENRTLLGKTKNAAGDFERTYYNNIPTASSLFTDLIREFSDSFRDELSPHYTTEYFTFMSNKPEIKSLEGAYDALYYERWDTALRLFADEYSRSGHIPSGYNAAILYFADGKTETALAIANELYVKYGSVKGLELYNYLKKLAAREDKANNQINSTEKSGATANGSDLVGL
ncbi:MAG: hypothetical protein J5891_08535 [Spirochaetales bacterium]|nr:hypothetical protein [Spirochaetales bacterium]